MADFPHFQVLFLTDFWNQKFRKCAITFEIFAFGLNERYISKPPHLRNTMSRYLVKKMIHWWPRNERILMRGKSRNERVCCPVMRGFACFMSHFEIFNPTRLVIGRKSSHQDEKKKWLRDHFFFKTIFFSKNQDFFGGFLETPKKPSGDPPGPSLGPQNAWKRSKNR